MNMKSNIYMLLNDIDSEADAFQEEEWSELETKRVKKKVLGRVRRKGKKKYVMAGVCSGSCGRCGGTIVLPDRHFSRD